MSVAPTQTVDLTPPSESDEPKGLYAEVIRRIGRGGRGHGCNNTNLTNQAPTDMAELAEYFASLKPNELAGVWVACVTDSSMFGFRPGELARALIVVAERLHGVTFQTIAPTPRAAVETQPQHEGSTKSPARRRRKRQTAGLDPRRVVPGANHGTVGAYSSKGCRCDACRAAMSDYQRNHYAKKKRNRQPRGLAA